MTGVGTSSILGPTAAAAGSRRGRVPFGVAGRRLILGALALLVPLAPAVLPSPALAQEAEFIELAAGRASTVRLAPYTTVTVDVSAPYANLVVGKPDIADALPLSNTSLYIQGNTPGRTTISVYDEQKRLLGVIDVVVEMNVQELNGAIQAIAPRSKVRADVINNQIRLSGEVPDGTALQQILDAARQYGGDTVINAIRVTDSQQVMLEVRFLEASRNAGREFGIGFNGRGTDTNFNVGGGQLLSNATPFSNLITEIIDASGLSVDLVIRALEDKGSVRRLAEPNLVALSGQTADFLAGGEVPVPRINKDGDAEVEFKEFGVKLAFTPIVQDDSLVTVNLKAEVSDIDFNNSVLVAGQQVPGFATRRTTTTVDLRDGQSFSVSGLLQTNNIRQQQQVPWIGQIPVLGALFRSSNYQKQETDLVVIVTPHIVRPAKPGEALRTPLDGTRPANDPELFLLGMTEVTDVMIRGFENGNGVAGPYGHILTLPAAAGPDVYKK